MSEYGEKMNNTDDLEPSIAVIPCYNCEDNIGLVVRECLNYVNHLLVIDDCSTDKSAEIASSAGAEVIKLQKNQGVGFALQTGLKIAIQKKYSTIVTLDADGAHNPDDIPNLINSHLNNNNILTIGNRWKEPIHVNIIPSPKFWANQFASRLVATTASIFLPDVACGFRVLNKSLIELLNGSAGFGFLYEMLFLAQKAGRIGYACVDVRYDANDLWITKQNELENLVETCIVEANDNHLKFELGRFIQMVKNWEKINILFETKTGDKDIFILHPIREYHGFQFQRQHNILSNLHKSENTISINWES